MRSTSAPRLRPILDAARKSFAKSRQGIRSGDPEQVARALNQALDHLDAADRLRAAQARLVRRLA